MDKKTVFVKTREGEEAMRQRTRLVQRNLRNILIMVDGHATVADLAKRFGDDATTEAALRELLAGGFIAEMECQLDFTAQPTPAEAVPVEDVPVLTSPASAPLPQQQVVPDPEPPPLVEEINVIPPEYESIPPSHRQAEGPKPSAPPPTAGPSWIDRLGSLFAGMMKMPGRAPEQPKRVAEADFEAETGGPDLAPIKRASKIGLPMLALMVVVGLPVLLGLTLILYPWGRHLPDIERNASAALQQPVKVGDIGFSFLPRPHIAMHSIAVGQGGGLSIASVHAVPDFLTLLGDHKAFSEVSLQGVAVKDTELGRLAKAASGSLPVRIGRIVIEGLSLGAGDAELDGISGEVNMSASGAMETIRLQDREGTLKVDLRPQGEAFRLVASGSNWKPAFLPEMVFQSVDAQGELGAGRLDLGKLEIRAYDGVLAGKASLSWAGESAFAGDFEAKHMRPAKLLAALGSPLAADGELSAQLKLSARAGSLGKLKEELRTEGRFELKRGYVMGFDLGEAVRNAGREPTRGGETKFEQLTGTILVEGKETRLGNLRLASGLMSAAGNIGISRDEQFSGTMNVDLKSSAATLRVTLAVGGTGKFGTLTSGRR